MTEKMKRLGERARRISKRAANLQTNVIDTWKKYEETMPSIVSLEYVQAHEHAIDAQDHALAAIELLTDVITERTAPRQAVADLDVALCHLKSGRAAYRRLKAIHHAAIR